MRAVLLLLLACLAAQCASFSVKDQLSFPTDIADPACIQVDIINNIVYTVAPPPVTDYNTPSFQITATRYNDSEFEATELSGRLGDGAPTACLLTPGGDGILIGTSFGESDARGALLTDAPVSGATFVRGSNLAAFVIASPFMVFVLNVPAVKSSDVLSLYSTYYSPSINQATPLSVDVLYDLSRDRVYVPVADSGGMKIMSLNVGTALSQPAVVAISTAPSGPNRMGAYLSATGAAAYYCWGSSIYSVDLNNWLLASTFINPTGDSYMDIASANSGNSLWYITQNEIGRLDFATTFQLQSVSGPQFPFAAPCNFLTEFVLDSNNQALILSRDTTQVLRVSNDYSHLLSPGTNDSLCSVNLNGWPGLIGFFSQSQYTSLYPAQYEPHAFLVDTQQSLVYTCGNGFVRAYTYSPNSPTLTYAFAGGFFGDCWQMIQLTNGDIILSGAFEIYRVNVDLKLLQDTVYTDYAITWLSYNDVTNKIYAWTVAPIAYEIDADNFTNFTPFALPTQAFNVFAAPLDTSRNVAFIGTCNINFIDGPPSSVIEFSLDTFQALSIYNVPVGSNVCYNTASFFDPLNERLIMIDSYITGSAWQFDVPGVELRGSFSVNSESYGYALDASRNQGIILGRKADFSPYLYSLCTSSKPFLGPTDITTYPRSLSAGIMWDGTYDSTNNLVWFLSSNSVIRIDPTGSYCSQLPPTSTAGILSNGGSGRPGGVVAGVVIFFLIFIGVALAVVYYVIFKVRRPGPPAGNLQMASTPAERSGYAMESGASPHGHQRFHDEDSDRRF